MPDSARDAMAAAVKKRPLSTLLREQRQRIAALESELAAAYETVAALGNGQQELIARAEALNVKANDYAKQAQEAEDVANEEHRRAEALSRKIAETERVCVYDGKCFSSGPVGRGNAKRRGSAESDHAECQK